MPPGLGDSRRSYRWFLCSVFYLLRAAEPAARLSAAALAGVLTLRSAALPRLLGAYSALAAGYAFIVGAIGSFSETGALSSSDGALGLIAFLLFVIWLLATGATLTRDPRPAAELPRLRARNAGSHPKNI